MLRLNDKCLPLLLVLLLGLAPFARGFADTVSVEQHNPAAMHEAGHHHGLDENDCSDCSASHICGASSCTCYQCGTCSVSLLHEPLITRHASLSPLIPTDGFGALTSLPSLLFRPPRA